MSAPSDFPPTASLRTLRLRADMLDWLRAFFRDHGYWEVQTPVLSRDTSVDAWLDPFAVPVSDDPHAPMQTGYLQTSPEFAMKRLLADGADAIFQIGPAFRKGEVGPLHNPEFTMVEWYRVGDTHHDQMSFTEQLCQGFLTAATQRTDASQRRPLDAPFPRLTYNEAFHQACGSRVIACPTADLHRMADQHDVTVPASLSPADRDGWLNLLLAEVVEPFLKTHWAVFLHDYPASQAALARVRHDDPPVAERFELYLDGIEICNGYHELTDPQELRRRIAEQSQLRAAARLAPLPTDSRLLDAMEAGLSDCAGVALGFDRLLMTALGCPSIADVIAFPFDRA